MLVNQSYPHPPYAVPEPYFSMYDRAAVPFPIGLPAGFAGKPKILEMIHKRMRMDEITDDELREMVAIYYGMITKTDHNLGTIVAALTTASGAWDGFYKFLLNDGIPGTYTIELDMSSVKSTYELTTAGSFTYDIVDGDDILSADFGLYEASQEAPAARGQNPKQGAERSNFASE